MINNKKNRQTIVQVFVLLTWSLAECKIKLEGMSRDEGNANKTSTYYTIMILFSVKDSIEET